MTEKEELALISKDCILQTIYQVFDEVTGYSTSTIKHKECKNIKRRLHEHFMTILYEELGHDRSVQLMKDMVKEYNDNFKQD